ncbi:MAG TPA: hypothetical protein PLJ11_00760 [Methanomassiliicoccales archaeon]|nr:hypothetical protein [Methanomassiliicoccales archaeon]
MRRDERGIEGLPLRLLIVALLISLTLPAMLSVLDGTTAGMAERKAAEVAEDIARTVEEMAAAGPGNVRVVDVPVDLPPNVVLNIGGGNGTAASARIAWSAGGDEGARYLRGVCVLSGDNAPVGLTPGDRMRLECPPGQWGVVTVAKL